MDNFFCPDFKSFLEFIALFDTPYFEIDHDDSHPFFFQRRAWLWFFARPFSASFHAGSWIALLGRVPQNGRLHQPLDFF